MKLELLGYTAYTCDRCHEHFVAPFGNEQVSCTVLHPAGECCHYGEIHVDFQLAVEGINEGLWTAGEKP